MTNPITGVILAGGKSLRMGRNKALIEIDGIPIIDRIHRVFKDLFKEIFIITDQDDLFRHLQAKAWKDLYPNRGALAGLYTGLYYSSFQYSFCVACDMPFLNARLIQFLARTLDGEDVLVPKTEDGLQPLHAFYSKNCLGPVKALLDRGGDRIIDFYDSVKVRFVEEKDFLFLDPGRESFININTPEELTLLRARHAKTPLSHSEAEHP